MRDIKTRHKTEGMENAAQGPIESQYIVTTTVYDDLISYLEYCTNCITDVLVLMVFFSRV